MAWPLISFYLQRGPSCGSAASKPTLQCSDSNLVREVFGLAVVESRPSPLQHVEDRSVNLRVLNRAGHVLNTMSVLRINRGTDDLLRVARNRQVRVMSDHENLTPLL